MKDLFAERKKVFFFSKKNAPGAGRIKLTSIIPPSDKRLKQRPTILVWWRR